MKINSHDMKINSHDMKINSHVMRIVFWSALQQNFECTGKVFGGGGIIFCMVATGRCMMEASGNVLRGGYNPQEKNGTIGKR